MFEVFKIINNMYSTVSVPVLPFAPSSSVTKGNSFKLLNQRFTMILENILLYLG